MRYNAGYKYNVAHEYDLDSHLRSIWAVKCTLRLAYIHSVANRSHISSRSTKVSFRAMAQGHSRIDLPGKGFFTYFEKYMLPVSSKKVAFSNLNINGGEREKQKTQKHLTSASNVHLLEPEPCLSNLFTWLVCIEGSSFPLRMAVKVSKRIRVCLWCSSCFFVVGLGGDLTGAAPSLLFLI